MFKTIINAFKTPDVRKRILYTLLLIVLFRLGCFITVPGVNTVTLNEAMSNASNGIAGLIDLISGGAFSRFSIFAMTITPYITASIVIQLLGMVIPSLERLMKEGGEEGRNAINKYTKLLTIVLALIEGIGLYLTYKSSGIFVKTDFLTGFLVVISLMAGTSLLMWLGDQITNKGIGNGISIILLINIVARIPSDLISLYNQFIKSAANVTNRILAAVIILVLIVAMFAFIVWLQDGERKIPVQYAKKMQGRKMFGGQSSHIPLKVNTAGVIPVIFASSMLQLPVVIASFAGVKPASGEGASLIQKFLKVCNQSDWCNISSWGDFKYTLGLLVYIALVIFFAYFYTSVTFNPLEISNNMKKQGGFIPGIRPGKPTTDYLTNVLNSIIFIGAVAMVIVCVLPIVFSGVFGANVSFTGTSLIIIVGVVIETLKQLESQMLVRNYKGFLGN